MLARLLVLALALSPSVALAWSAQGHRMVGELAERQLSVDARSALAPLLQGLDEPTLAGISVWADEVRSTPEWRHSARWHYVNFETLDCEWDKARTCPDGQCITGAIEAQQAVLANFDAPLRERRHALKFLVHFVGDIHQPLHAGLREDRGGNDFQLRYRNQGRNLHSIWDGPILASRESDWRTYADLLEPRMSDPAGEPALSVEQAARGWALESCRSITRAGLYPERRGAPITARYLDQHRPLAEQRVILAAQRLAALLEATLAPGTWQAERAMP